MVQVHQYEGNYWCRIRGITRETFRWTLMGKSCMREINVGLDVDTAVYLEVQEVGTLEHMVFISEGATGAEAAGTILPWGVGVPA